MLSDYLIYDLTTGEILAGVRCMPEHSELQLTPYSNAGLIDRPEWVTDLSATRVENGEVIPNA